MLSRNYELVQWAYRRWPLHVRCCKKVHVCYLISWWVLVIFVIYQLLGWEVLSRWSKTYHIFFTMTQAWNHSNTKAPITTSELSQWICKKIAQVIFSERSCSLYAIAHPSVCLLSVTFVRPTQAVEIFGNISMGLGTLAIRWHPLKILRRSSQGNPSDGELNTRG